MFYFAHEGHEHAEAVAQAAQNSSLDPLVLVGGVAAAIILLAGLYDIFKKK